MRVSFLVECALRKIKMSSSYSEDFLGNIGSEIDRSSTQPRFSFLPFRRSKSDSSVLKTESDFTDLLYL